MPLRSSMPRLMNFDATNYCFKLWKFTVHMLVKWNAFFRKILSCRLEKKPYKVIAFCIDTYADFWLKSR